MRRIAWACVLVWLCGCEIPSEVQAEMACTTICNCIASPVQVDECIAECIDEGDLGSVPEDCFECIQSHANQCSTLERDCEPLCEMPQPLPEDLPDGGMP